VIKQRSTSVKRETVKISERYSQEEQLSTDDRQMQVSANESPPLLSHPKRFDEVTRNKRVMDDE
jgi:hypothetical protein